MAPKLEPVTIAADSTEYPTVLNEKTCVRRGLCPVGHSRRSIYRLYYEIHGALDATNKMVWIMGFNNTCFSWCSQVDHFGSKPDTSVLVFDNRGVGNSDTGPSGMYKTSGMAQDLVDLLDFLGWNKPRSLDVIGVSMGGMILQQLCLLIPERMISVVFTSTRAGDKSGVPPVKTLFTVGRMLFKSGAPEDRIALVISRLFPTAYLDAPAPDGSGKTNREQREEVMLAFHQKRRTQPISGVMGQMAAVSSHMIPPNVLEKMAASLAPAKMVVFTGTCDEILPSADSHKLHACLPGAELVVWDDAGHALCTQDPERHDLLIERAMREGREAIAASSSISAA